MARPSFHVNILVPLALGPRKKFRFDTTFMMKIKGCEYFWVYGTGSTI
jgi:hypothetical protein